MMTEIFVYEYDKFFDSHLIKCGVLDIEPPHHYYLDIIITLKSVTTRVFLESKEDVKIT